MGIEDRIQNTERQKTEIRRQKTGNGERKWGPVIRNGEAEKRRNGGRDTKA
jgi:hypothetical protein